MDMDGKAELLAALRAIEQDAQGTVEDWELYGIDRKDARKFAYRIADICRAALAKATP